jgi:hypothetical protein
MQHETTAQALPRSGGFRVHRANQDEDSATSGLAQDNYVTPELAHCRIRPRDCLGKRPAAVLLSGRTSRCLVASADVHQKTSDLKYLLTVTVEVVSAFLAIFVSSSVIVSHVPQLPPLDPGGPTCAAVAQPGCASSHAVSAQASSSRCKRRHGKPVGMRASSLCNRPDRNSRQSTRRGPAGSVGRGADAFLRLTIGTGNKMDMAPLTALVNEHSSSIQACKS